MLKAGQMSTDDAMMVLRSLGWESTGEAPNATWFAPPNLPGWRPFRIRHDNPDMMMMMEQVQMADAIRAWMLQCGSP